MRIGLASLTLVVSLVGGCADSDVGTLRLRILDGGAPTAARLVLTDSSRRQIIPENALAVAGDCGWTPIHNWIGWWARVQLQQALEPRVYDVTTGTDQFYVDGELEVDLRPGTYRLRASKGPEYKLADVGFEIEAGNTTDLAVGLERWIDMPANGWYSADDHLHIPRPHPSFDSTILRWMSAEDLHVANLLQMGLADDVQITPQSAFGAGSIRQSASNLIASGQENPRTHVVGHAIILGASRYIDFPEAYLSYGRFFRDARRQGALSGFAHWGLGGADEGLAVWAPQGLVDFLEVLGFGLPYYETWYDLLNLGLRVAPTAGTDYPCGPSLPGRERFYTLVEPPLTFSAWLEGVRRGRTFITNGPMLDFEVDGATVGDEILLDGPSEVMISARVRFDPGRDAIHRLELVQAGAVVLRVDQPSAPGLLELEVSVPIESSTWMALRVTGSKREETPLSGIDALEQALFHLPRPGARDLFESVDAPIPPDGSPRPSAAHTAPVYIVVQGTPPIGEQALAGEAARRWLHLLDLLEARFEERNIESMAGFPGRGDGLSLEDLARFRSSLLESIESSRSRLHTRRTAREAGGS